MDELRLEKKLSVTLDWIVEVTLKNLHFLNVELYLYFMRRKKLPIKQVGKWGYRYDNEDLPNEEEIKTAEKWIKFHLEPSNTIYHSTSYGMKHIMENGVVNFSTSRAFIQVNLVWNKEWGESRYVSNGAFIQAMFNCGYEPYGYGEADVNVYFKCRPKYRSFKPHKIEGNPYISSTL